VLEVNNLCIKDVLIVNLSGEKEGIFLAALSYFNERE
jgi:hypothetical protein